MATFGKGKNVKATDTSGDLYAGTIDRAHFVDKKLMYYYIDIKQKWNGVQWEEAPPEKRGVKSYFADKVQAMEQAPVAGFVT